MFIVPIGSTPCNRTMTNYVHVCVCVCVSGVLCRLYHTYSVVRTGTYICKSSGRKVLPCLTTETPGLDFSSIRQGTRHDLFVIQKQL